MRKLVRMFLPMPASVIAMVAFLYFGWDFIQWLTLHRLHLEGNPQLLDLFRRPQGAILLVFCAIAGIWRINAHHPASNAGYKWWLATTPWTAKMPLPFGSIIVTWQDGLLLLIAMGSAVAHSVPSPAHVLCAFGVAYSVVATFSLLRTRQPNDAYILATGLAAMVPTWSRPWLAAGVAVALCAFACFALRRSLMAFPWETGKPLTFGECPAIPMDRLGPLPVGQRLSWREAMMLASLCGVWAYVIARAYGMGNAPTPVLVARLGVAGVCVGFIRMLVYICLYVPPISFVGRLATGRLVIPGYDKIFLAPACGFFFSIAGPLTLSHWGLSGPLWLGITIGLILAANFGLGPGLNVWRLTGSHRIIMSHANVSHEARRSGSARSIAGA
ncbi:MAG: hypothetical protein JWL69_800 [Phycisphaerales bacterium]|nr:hypothetical protein [Phycisphaerales bacterium]